ncbi:hypothetical protein A4A49_28503 [Nicotiana attenuata]|uniref:DUF4283 domain-containing protein n=1 Tax=Nicotiana attenuata TaxID=49451 RepID=A0A1J6K020_NICAT|nr:hypothetical protein A4A49_28503 [Nicotiana attenuata]
MHDQRKVEKITDPSQELATKELVNGDKVTSSGANKWNQGTSKPSFAAAVQSELPTISEGEKNVDVTHDTHLEKPAVFFKAEDYFVNLEQECRFTLIGKLYKTKPPMEDIRKAFISQFHLKGKVKIAFFDFQHVCIDFTNEVDYTHIKLKNFVDIIGTPMKILLWSPDFKLEVETPAVPVWILIHQLQWHLFRWEVVSRMIQSIGVAIAPDQATYSKSRGNVAKIKVEINLLKPKLDQLWLALKGWNLWLDIEYEGVSFYCIYCKMQGSNLEKNHDHDWSGDGIIQSTEEEEDGSSEDNDYEDDEGSMESDEFESMDSEAEVSNDIAPNLVEVFVGEATVHQAMTSAISLSHLSPRGNTKEFWDLVMPLQIAMVKWVFWEENLDYSVVEDDDQQMQATVVQHSPGAMDGALRGEFGKEAYERISGQMVNRQKSGCYVSSKLNCNKIHEIRASVGFPHFQFLMQYLGRSIFPGRKKVVYFNKMVAEFSNKLQVWQGRLLSFGGKAVLIKSVLAALPIHLIAAINPPKTALTQAEKIMASFFWGKIDDKEKHHWVAWKSLCYPVKEGGVGFRSLHDTYKAFAA